MHLKKSILFLLFLLSALPAQAHAGGFVYPFDKISTTSCKWNAWSTLSDDCKMDLPKITGADYKSYEKQTVYRRVYSVLWGATYDYGWDTGLGSHLGVDIATAAGTPVRSIGEGTVVTASFMTGWGNVVTVKHTLADSTSIYSNYAHLSKIIAKKGMTVKAAETIGEVGNTGNSYGNHLHFQIDTTSQAHPYYYSACGKGIDVLSVVNKGLCRDYLTNNTIDPIAFLESGKVSAPVKSDIEAVRNRPVEVADRTKMKSRAEIQEEEIQEFLKKNSVNVGLSTDGTNVLVGGWISAWASSKDFRNQAVRGNLPELGLDIVTDDKGLYVFPNKIVALDGGSREFKIKGLKPGAYDVAFRMGKTVVARRTVVVLSETDAKTAVTAEIRAPSEILLGEDKNALVVMKTKYGTALLDSRYDGKFKLTAINGNAKLCNVSQNPKADCRPENLVDELVFTYADTYRGALQAKVRSFSFVPVALALTRLDLKKPLSMTRTKSDIKIGNPRGLDKSYAYYPEAIAILEKGAFPLKDGYMLQDREFVGSQAKELVRRYLAYRFLKSGDDKLRKKAVAEKITAFETEFKSLDNFTRISRGQFADMVLRAKGSGILVSDEKVFVDESGKWKNAVTTLRRAYSFSWRDQFGERYFQPDKDLTVGEALYLVEKIGF